MNNNDAIARNHPRAPPTSQVGDAMIIPDAIGKLCVLYTRFGNTSQFADETQVPRRQSRPGQSYVAMNKRMAFSLPHDLSIVAPTSRCVDGIPDPHRGEWHVDVLDTERTQRVEHGVNDSRRRSDRSGLADTLNAKRVGLRRDLDQLRDEGRKVLGARHAVVEKAAGQQLTRRVIGNILP